MLKKELIVRCVNTLIKIDDLNPSSREKVIFKCERCGKLCERQFRNLTNKDEYLCISCVNKEIANTDEFKKKMSTKSKGISRNKKSFSFHVDRIKTFGYSITSTEKNFNDNGEIFIKCEKHNHNFKYKGTRTSCPKCANEARGKRN